MNNSITVGAIVVISVCSIFILGIEAKDIAIASIAGLVGYLTGSTT